jgi:hypothetical protein
MILIDLDGNATTRDTNLEVYSTRRLVVGYDGPTNVVPAPELYSKKTLNWEE